MRIKLIFQEIEHLKLTKGHIKFRNDKHLLVHIHGKSVGEALPVLQSKNKNITNISKMESLLKVSLSFAFIMSESFDKNHIRTRHLLGQVTLKAVTLERQWFRMMLKNNLSI